MKKIAFCLLVALAMPSVALSETRDDSANFMMHGCRDALSGDTHKTAYFQAGLCAGAVNAIVFTGNVECIELQKGYLASAPRGVDPPKAYTVEQAMRIVVKYIDARPEKMHELDWRGTPL